MSLTDTQRIDGYRFFAIAFGAAPGLYYFKQLEAAYGVGMTTKQVVNEFTKKSVFTDRYATSLSNEEFANRLIEDVVGNSATESAKREAKQSVVEALAFNLSRGDVVYQIFNNIANKPANDPKWANVAKKMQNQVEVAKFVSEYWPLNTKDLSVLRGSISSVSHDTDVSTVEKIKELIKLNGVDLAGLTLYTSASDLIYGTDEADMIDGGRGNDTIYGYGGNDVLIGGSGNDYIYGGSGQDYIEGGDGADFIDLGANNNSYWDYSSQKYVYVLDAYREYANGGDGADTIYGGYGSDTIHGGEGNDLIYVDTYTAGRVSDYPEEFHQKFGGNLIYGDGGKDTIYGGFGNDTIFGGEGADDITVYHRDNYIDGGDGNDWLVGGDGTDTIFGGEGNDYIYIRGGKDGNFSFADGGIGDDNINASISGEGESIKIIAGEGADSISISNRYDAHIELDLAESVDLYDYVSISLASSSNRPYNPVIINNFSLEKDKIDIGYFNLYGALPYYTYSYPTSSYNNKLNVSYIQEVNSVLTPWAVANSNSTHPDSYGKGVFIIKDAAAESTDLSTVAKFLDPYGNNAKYGESYVHYFIFNIQDKGVAVYQFKDDTGANDRIVADELTPVAFLTGISTSDLSASDINFFLI